MAAQQQAAAALQKKNVEFCIRVCASVCAWSLLLLLLLLSYASFYYFVDFLYSNSSSHTETKRNDDGMNILHLSIVVYIGNGDGVGALRRRRSDEATQRCCCLCCTHTHTPIHMNMSYLSIILFCISDAVFRFAFFSANCFASFWAISHKHMHTCISVLFLQPAPPPTLFPLSLRCPRLCCCCCQTCRCRFCCGSFSPTCSLALSLIWASAWYAKLLLFPACFFCSCCCSFSFALPAAPSLLVVAVLLPFMGVVCLILRAQIKSESLNRSAAAQQQQQHL